MATTEQTRFSGKTFLKGLESHIVDTTALLTSTNPVYSTMEVGIAKMTDEVSMKSRISVAWLSYLGMGFAFAKGRDLSRNAFKISQDSSELVQTTHDMAYTATFNAIVAPLIYLSNGADVKQAISGGLTAAAMSSVMGPVMGYAVDVARDLAGIKPCERKSYPNLIRKLNSKAKKGLAGLLVAGSIGTMAGIYALTPDRHEDNIPQQYEQVIETSQDQIQP